MIIFTSCDVDASHEHKLTVVFDSQIVHGVFLQADLELSVAAVGLKKTVEFLSHLLATTVSQKNKKKKSRVESSHNETRKSL